MEVLAEVSMNEIKFNFSNIKLSQLLFSYKFAAIITELYIGIQKVTKQNPSILRENFDTVKNFFYYDVFAAK
jgi:hypothetical protein